jgi:ubiquinone/menaquinone biosynthesis C-methylase UbiE
MPIITTRRGPATPIQTQCQKPHGWLGRYSLWRMNISHSKLTDWGLSHVSIAPHFTILDVGCGGGRTVSKLAALTTQGKVFGVDFSDASVAASRKTNARWIADGRVEIREASVSQLPFADAAFDLVTAVETHFWWPNLPADIREVFRVTKPGGAAILIAEIYKGANTLASKMFERHGAQLGATLLSVDEHRELLANAGFSDVQVVEQPVKGWICATGKKPVATSS